MRQFESVKEREKPNKLPPKLDFETKISYMVIGQPSPEIDIKSVPAWVEHFKYIWRTLRQVRDSLQKQEQRFDKERWKMENEIRGLKKTVDWQSKALGEQSPHFRLVVKPLQNFIRYIPESIPRVVEKDMKQDGNKGLPPHGKIPFFTEAFLYPLMGKDDARTILALMRTACEAAGLDLNDELDKLYTEKNPNRNTDDDD